MTQPEQKNAPAAQPAENAAAEKKEVNPEKEAKRLAKLAKFQEKQAKQAAEKAAKAAAGGEKKEKKDAKKAAKPATVETPFVNTTPKGEKKDLSGPMADAYDPTAVESAWYDWWEKEKFFSPDLTTDGKLKPEGNFVIPIPPPNVTGSLHLGHALTNSIQDCLTRWHRMNGKSALYVPGCDHAGIATQTVVEKRLMKERGITRHALGRDTFVKEVWKWKDAHEDRIYDQIRRLGSSVDWDRKRFTLDPDLNKAVVEAFVQLHDEGIIYRSNRLVNWCTKLKTALSNLEVETEELEGRTMRSVPDHDDKKYEFGTIISFAYQVENSDEKIVVATTRLETMLGDTAICVNPKDARYTHLHGKYVIHPFQNRRIPIITDDYADPAFGTGAVKITPAHDFNDYQVGKRNNLEFISILTDDGLINEAGAPFTGQRRFDARLAVLEALKEKGLYVETKDNKMQLPICTRSGNVVEPMLKPQWWVDCKDMAAAALDAVKSGEMQIIPETSEKEWFRWLENIQDWCISRQLWWGHRVPAYFIRIKGHEELALTDESKYWVSGRTEEEARERALKKFPDVKEGDLVLEQDEDVLDTWFSSGLWPFSIFGWPNKTKDLDLFFPNSLLETGWDILFFWVARMVMMSMKLTGKVPFKQVYCHAMVRDAHGRKMSKSLGNVIDPLDVIEGISLELLHQRLEDGNLDPREVVKAKAGQKEDFPNGIPKCGTDALRFALLAYVSAGRDINLDILRVEGYRKFCNKLWNATKLVMMKLGDGYKPLAEIKLTGNESLADKWILSKLNSAVRDTNKYLDQMNFMQATSSVYQFWLTELCDVYLEISKPVTDGTNEEAKAACRNTLYICLDAGLKLLHPFMPFITEELWQRLPRRPSDSCPTISKAPYPKEIAEWDSPKAEKDYEFLNEVVHAIRSLISDYSIKEATVYVRASPEVAQLLSSQTPIIKTLARACKNLNVLPADGAVPVGCAPYSVTEDCNLFLLVKGFVDFEVELQKLDVKIGKAQKSLADWKKKTEVEGYEVKVKAEIREINDQKIKGLEAEIAALEHAKSNFVKLRDE
ncbi:hypothetical protein HK097_000051 [Rhizophlyctis rosea]|uniref:Probable valine--tRNA ligase, cytoplasmic n=1 Tax=Rhizophlyctis rosea TaxID=64517 RepID=A0AAD5SMZ3_9FUNG|nr:hypothetical protein HK097_000051 [Rhizophlyctis rosea]